MEQCMRECMRKLALWYTRTFKPIMTHEELEPVMATLGFVAQPEKPAPNRVVWKEYVFAGRLCRCRSPSSQPLPRPRLPCRRIDGLHIYTYRAFIDAVNFYLEMDDISELFHIRGMPLHKMHDRNKKFRRMDEDESVFVYREGTLDQATYNLYHVDKNNSIAGATTTNAHASIIIRNKGANVSVGTIVPLKDIIV